jgi:N-acyl-D-amino-acid deacylase
MKLSCFLQLTLCLIFLAINVVADEISVTGIEQTQCVALDEWMKSFLAEHNIPGGSLAVARDGKLVYGRGFGWADREAKTPVQPDSLFRIASVSKSITAVTILKLAEEKRLKLDDKVLDYLEFDPHFEAPDKEGTAKFDERWRQITIAHCLSHTGGWDREKSYDPMFQAIRMTKSMNISLPISPPQIIRYQLGQSLDFDPGERYAYSNFGRIIEKITGQPYEDYIRQAVLRPLGIERARIGGSLESERFDGEVKYYVVNDGRGTATTGPGAGEAKVSIPYGVWRQETLDSHGGWIASAPDLVRFAAAFDISEGGKSVRSKFLSAATVEQMFSHHADIPSVDDKTKITAHYGYGWILREEADSTGKMTTVARHGGALACTAASLMHFPDGLNVAVLFNLGQSADGKFLGRRVEEPLTRHIREIKNWPTAAVP